MDEKLVLKNRLKEARAERKLSQTQLAEMVGVSRNSFYVLPLTRSLKSCFTSKPNFLYEVEVMPW